MNQNIMKYCNIKSIPILLCVLIFSITGITSCKKSDGDRKPLSNDKTKPGPVTNVKVKNFNGGAILSYTLPDNENLLYVVAEYKINDKVVRQTKSSYFLDTIRVEGFQKSKDYTVTLHAVTRAEVKSDPVEITVHPDTPYYQMIRNSLALSPDFGGLNIKAKNIDRRAIGLNMIAIEPANNKFEIKDRHFSSSAQIDYSIRGYESVASKFGVFVTDQFGNVSDTLLVNLTPLYEEELDKSKFFNYRLFSDATIGYGGEVQYLWDGRTVETGGAFPWHTTIGPVPKPIQATFGIGRTYKLSHFKMWTRGGYGYGNPRNFTIWGTNKDNPADANTPAGTAAGTVVGDWVSLGDYHYPDPPSGLSPDRANAADLAYTLAGVDFNVPFNSPSVKYLRVTIKDTWGGVDYSYIMELTFYGIPE